MEGFLTRGWDLIVPGCGGTSTLLTWGVTLAARWTHEPHPTNIQPVGLGVLKLARRYIDPGFVRFRLRVGGAADAWKDF